MENPADMIQRGFFACKKPLKFYYIDCLGTFFSLGNIELDHLSFVQGFKPITLNGRIMDKNIPASFFLDKPIPFGVVKPFHLPGCHILHLPAHLAPMVQASLKLVTAPRITKIIKLLSRFSLLDENSCANKGPHLQSTFGVPGRIDPFS